MGKRDNTENSNSVNNSLNGRHRKDERRKSAFARLEKSSKLSTKQKLAKLNAINPNGGQRQRLRYENELKKENK